MGMPRVDPYSDTRYRQLRAALKRRSRAAGAPCWLCGEAIDYDLPHTDAMSFTADHVHSLVNGGRVDSSDLKPAHRRCNGKRQGGATRTGGPVATTIEW
jgi:5-methylcytosine-specific restriction endonuclease McrA